MQQISTWRRRESRNSLRTRTNISALLAERFFIDSPPDVRMTSIDDPLPAPVRVWQPITTTVVMSLPVLAKTPFSASATGYSRYIKWAWPVIFFRYTIRVFHDSHQAGDQPVHSRTPHNPYPLRGRSVLWVMRGEGKMT